MLFEGVDQGYCIVGDVEQVGDYFVVENVLDEVVDQFVFYWQVEDYLFVVEVCYVDFEYVVERDVLEEICYQLVDVVRQGGGGCFVYCGVLI